MAMSSTRVNLEWNPPAESDTAITGYNIYRDGERIGFVVGTTFVDTGLTPETTYSYSLSSTDARGLEGARSDAASATTDAAQDVIPPAPPSGLRLAGS
jgi:cellulose 1,4-beta-cellobiosidase